MLFILGVIVYFAIGFVLASQKTNKDYKVIERKIAKGNIKKEDAKAIIGNEFAVILCFWPLEYTTNFIFWLLGWFKNITYKKASKKVSGK